MPTNSEAIGVFLSRVMRCQGGLFGDWVRGRAVPFLFSCRFDTPKTTTKLLTFVFSFDLNNMLNDPIVGSLVRRTSCIFNDFIVVKGQILWKFLAKLSIKAAYSTKRMSS